MLLRQIIIYCYWYYIAVAIQSCPPHFKVKAPKKMQTSQSKSLRAEAFAAAGPLGLEALEAEGAGAANRDW